MTGVADGQVPLEGGQGGLVEHLAHQAHVLEDKHAAAVGDGHAGRLLAAVLEDVEPVVHEVGDRFTRPPDPEDSACLARMVNI